MTLLFDQNLSPRLCDRLRDIWTDVVHVRPVGLASGDDSAVWAYARQHGLVIVSKDGDFADRPSRTVRYRTAPERGLMPSSNAAPPTQFRLIYNYRTRYF